MKDEKVLVLFSGGQDSTTALYWAKGEFKEVKALSIYYGQQHDIELGAAEEIAEMAGVKHKTIFLNDDILKGGALLGDGEIPTEPTEGIAPTWVPMRNLLFLTIAANRALMEGFNGIVIGVNEIDFSGYPDCTDDFIFAAEDTIRLGSKSKLTIYTPLLYLNKKEIVELAQSLEGCMEALKWSHTCYRGAYPPCGQCPACILRAKGFEEAGVKDPIFEREEI